MTFSAHATMAQPGHAILEVDATFGDGEPRQRHNNVFGVTHIEIDQISIEDTLLGAQGDENEVSEDMSSGDD